MIRGMCKTCDSQNSLQRLADTRDLNLGRCKYEICEFDQRSSFPSLFLTSFHAVLVPFAHNRLNMAAFVDKSCVKPYRCLKPSLWF